MPSSPRPSPLEDSLRLATPRSGISAWLLSVIVHTVVAIGLALVFAAPDPPRGLPGDEPGRSVEIAVIRSQPNAADPFDAETSSAAPAAATSQANLSQANLSQAPPSPFPTNDASPKPLASGVLPAAETTPGVPSGELLLGLVNSTGGTPTVPSDFDEAAFIAAEKAARPAAGPKGPLAETSLFGSKITGRSFVFLLDASKSMGGEGLGAIEAAEGELIAALARLNEHHKFQIVAYNHRPSYLDRKLIPADAHAKAAAKKFLGGIVAFGGTEHYAAMSAALNRKPEVIVVFTDGGEPDLTSAMLRQITVRAKGNSTTIHTFHFGDRARASDAEEHFLAKLARLNGGGYAYINMSRR